MKRLSTRVKASVRRIAVRLVSGDTGDKQKLAEKNRRLKNLRRQLEKRDREIAGLRTVLAVRDGSENGVRADDIVWIFGAPGAPAAPGLAA